MITTITKMESTLILLIHFKKAPDSINHTFIYNTLKTLEFGSDIIRWVRTFLTKRNAQILLGGHLTDSISLEQGVPQGDIISPYIFILMAYGGDSSHQDHKDKEYKGNNLCTD